MARFSSREDEIEYHRVKMAMCDLEIRDYLAMKLRSWNRILELKGIKKEEEGVEDEEEKQTRLLDCPLTTGKSFRILNHMLGMPELEEVNSVDRSSNQPQT